jgi:hypothetical protein
MFLNLCHRLPVESFRRAEHHVHNLHGHHVRPLLPLMIMTKLTSRWFTNITGTAHMLWTGALPGTANDFDERDFIRHRDGLDDEESADTAINR